MISTVPWVGPMVFRCERCRAEKEGSYDGALPQCDECRDRAVNRPLKMFPSTLHAMKVWMRMADMQGQTYRRLWLTAARRLSAVDEAMRAMPSEDRHF